MSQKQTADTEQNKQPTPTPPKPASGPDFWTLIAFTLFIAAGLAVTAYGLVQSVEQQQPSLLLALGLIAVSVPASVFILVDRVGAAGSGDNSQLLTELKLQNKLLTNINDRMLISDQAKRISYRQQDRKALRDAIIHDIKAEDYEAAAALIDEMADTFGYREESEQFRQQLIEVQTHRREELLTKAVKRIDEICSKFEWEDAQHELARLRRLYPDHPAVVKLPKRIEAARDRHKNDLEREFLQAAERDDIEKAMELLKELDRYLTHEEAAQYMETARGVIGKKRQNLGVQFKMAAHDRDWITALAVGEQIIAEFPNSKFAAEARSMTDILRERANAQRAAQAQKQSG